MSRPYDFGKLEGKERLALIADKFRTLMIDETSEKRFEKYFGISFGDAQTDPLFLKLKSSKTGIQNMERPGIAMSMVFGHMMEKGFTFTDLLEAEDDLDYKGPDLDKAERVQRYKKELHASVDEFRKAVENAENGDLGRYMASAVKGYGNFNMTKELEGILASDKKSLSPQEYAKTEEGRLMSIAIYNNLGKYAREMTQSYRRSYPLDAFGRLITKLPDGVTDNPTFKGFMDAMSEEDFRTLENMGSLPSPIGMNKNPQRIGGYYNAKWSNPALENLPLLANAFAVYDELNEFLLDGKNFKEACVGGADYYAQSAHKSINITKQEIDEKLSSSSSLNHKFFSQDKDEKIKQITEGLSRDFKGSSFFWSKPLEEQEKIIKTCLPASLQGYAKDVTEKLVWNKSLDKLSYKEQEFMLDCIKENSSNCKKAAEIGKGAAKELYAGLEKQQEQYQNAIGILRKNELDRLTALSNKLNKEKKLNNSKQYIALITAVDEYKNALTTGRAEQREKAAEKVINSITAYYEHKGRRGVKEKDENKLICVERLNRFMSEVYEKNTLAPEDNYYLKYTGIPRKAAAKLEVENDKVKSALNYYLYTAYDKVKRAGEHGMEQGKTTAEQKKSVESDVEKLQAKLLGIDIKRERVTLDELIGKKVAAKVSHKPASGPDLSQNADVQKKDAQGFGKGN